MYLCRCLYEMSFEAERRQRSVHRRDRPHDLRHLAPRAFDRLFDVCILRLATAMLYILRTISWQVDPVPTPNDSKSCTHSPLSQQFSI